jgi:tetratricopeptide (TPR) repeat protein
LNAQRAAVAEKRKAVIEATGSALTFGTDFSRHAWARIAPAAAGQLAMTVLLSHEEAGKLWPGQAVELEIKAGLLGLDRITAVRMDEEAKLLAMLEVAPTATVALSGLTRIFAESGRMDRAEAMARRFVEVSDDPKPIWHIGATLFQRHQLQDAYRFMRMVYEKKPDTENTITVGWTLAKLGRREEGLPYLEKAVAMEPNNYFTHYHIAYVQMEMGRKEDAIASFRNVLKLKPNFPEIEQALKQLGARP